MKCSHISMTAAMTSFARQVFAAVLIIGLVAAVAYSFQILLLLFAGILLAILLRSVGTWLSERTRLSINWCMAVVLAGFVVFFFGSLAMFGMQIVNQADQLFWAVSQAYSQFHEKLAQYLVARSFNGLNLQA